MKLTDEQLEVAAAAAYTNSHASQWNDTPKYAKEAWRAAVRDAVATITEPALPTTTTTLARWLHKWDKERAK